MAVSLAVAVLAGVYWLQREQSVELRHRAEEMLRGIAELKAREVVIWRGERLEDGEVYRRSPSVTQAFQQWLNEPTPQRDAVLRRRVEQRLPVRR